MRDLFLRLSLCGCRGQTEDRWHRLSCPLSRLPSGVSGHAVLINVLSGRFKLLPGYWKWTRWKAESAETLSATFPRKVTALPLSFLPGKRRKLFPLAQLKTLSAKERRIPHGNAERPRLLWVSTSHPVRCGVPSL